MDFEITVGAIAAPTWNRNEVAEAVSAKLADYENVVYTPETISTAKADRAELNKLAKAIEDERKRVKALYNAPYQSFEKEVKEITGMIEKAVSAIDTQVKTFEARAREEKAAAVRSLWETQDFLGVPFEVIENPKWYLLSTPLKSVANDLDSIRNGIVGDMAVLRTIAEFQFEAVEKYKETASLSAAMQEVTRLKDVAARKAAYTAPAVAAEPQETHQPQEIAYTEDGMPDFAAIGDNRSTVIFRTKVTPDDKEAICEFLRSIGVEYEIIGG